MKTFQRFHQQNLFLDVEKKKQKLGKLALFREKSCTCFKALKHFSTFPRFQNHFQKFEQCDNVTLIHKVFPNTFRDFNSQIPDTSLEVVKIHRFLNSINLLVHSAKKT